jgi:hypothetical protein
MRGPQVPLKGPPTASAERTAQAASWTLQRGPGPHPDATAGTGRAGKSSAGVCSHSANTTSASATIGARIMIGPL